MTDEHPDARAAFEHAYNVLAWLQREHGIVASAELFPDGSGHLRVRKADVMRADVAATPRGSVSQELERLLHSSRWVTDPADESYLTLASCQGWHP